jgi:CHAT domain-containing protein/tetratricopeptide (TPR) repeat protein
MTDDLAPLQKKIETLYEAGRYAEAIPLAESLVQELRNSGRQGSLDYANNANLLALLYRNDERLLQAELLQREVIDIFENKLGGNHPLLGVALNNLAITYLDEGRFPEAEPLFKRALAILESSLSSNHPEVARILNNLGDLYREEGRFSEAIAIHKRALVIRQKTLPPDNPYIGRSFGNLGLAYMDRGDYSEAEPLLRQALAHHEQYLPKTHPDIANGLSNLASLYNHQGRYAEAVPLLERSLAMREAQFGSESSALAVTINNLAFSYMHQQRYGDAKTLFRRALAIKTKAFGPDHPSLITAHGNLAQLAFEQEDWTGALASERTATSILIKRGLRQRTGGRDTVKGEIEANTNEFRFFIRSAYRAGHEDASIRDETLQMGQWSLRTEAALALSQAMVRSLTDDDKLARLVRKRQDLSQSWQSADGQLSWALSAGDFASATGLQREIARLDKEIADLDTKLSDQFPDYVALANPTPIGISELQQKLAQNEAVVFILSIPEETFIWVVSKDDVRWARSDQSEESLQREVAALRCGLDYDGAWGASGSRCEELLNLTYTRTDRRLGKPLPFDVARAHTLYKALFREVEDLVKDKHLFIVPSGALNALPFTVLVTEKPAVAVPSTTAGYSNVAWLGTRNTLTVLPAVSSLKALRASAKASRATDAYLGFGNPLLTGPDGTDKSAWDHQHCQAAEPGERVRVTQARSAPALAPLLERGLADVKGLRRQYPLPETADELCAVARARGMTDLDKAVNLGARATEARVKALSGDGTLAHAGIVHFATHGLVAGETARFIGNHAEPAVLLTPPETASEEDDGLLTASEIAALKLDADWVILSACNTAAGDSVGGDALSGLARAFFYAGARALLVSHWYVDSKAAVSLITKSFDALKTDARIGRAEAVRRAMQQLIAGGDRTAHPSLWAPFVVVGEGGVGR